MKEQIPINFIIDTISFQLSKETGYHYLAEETHNEYNTKDENIIDLIYKEYLELEIPFSIYSEDYDRYKQTGDLVEVFKYQSDVSTLHEAFSIDDIICYVKQKNFDSTLSYNVIEILSDLQHLLYDDDVIDSLINEYNKLGVSCKRKQEILLNVCELINSYHPNQKVLSKNY